MKKLIVIFFLVGMSAQAQVWDKFIMVHTKNAKFNQPIGAYNMVACAEDSTWYMLTERREKNDSLATAIRLGEYMKFVDGSGGAGSIDYDSLGWYRKNAAVWQRGASDSVVPNQKITFKSTLGYVAAYSAGHQSKTQWLAAPGGVTSWYTDAYGTSGFGGNARNYISLSPHTSANVFGYESDFFGSFAYQLDEYGFYPTDYTTAGTYNQYIGTPGSPWNATYTKRVNLPATDTTGVGSTANVGTMMYYNGHFYGLKAGLPPTWVQLDN